MLLQSVVIDQLTQVTSAHFDIVDIVLQANCELSKLIVR